MFMKCSGLSDTVELHMRNDFPLVLKYAIPTLGDITFYLVPVIGGQATQEELSDYSDNEDGSNDNEE